MSCANRKHTRKNTLQTYDYALAHGKSCFCDVPKNEHETKKPCGGEKRNKKFTTLSCVLGESTPQNHDFIVYQKKAHGKLSELSQTTTTGN